MKKPVCLTIGVVVAMVALVVLVQRRGQSNGDLAQLRQERETLKQENMALKEENDTLRQQIARVPVAAGPQGQSAVDTNEERLRKGETELLRLRNQVSRLRQELNTVAPDGIDSKVLRSGSDRFDTSQTYRPPVEITLVAKTDSTNLRLGYAADQVIFNWEVDPSQLRVDGGPADGHHQAGVGSIPAGEYVNIQWIVTEGYQEIFVNGESRFRHQGDYSQINRPVSVFPANGSTVTLKAFSVKPLTSTAQ